ncbi:MAG: hypothetical protein JWN30_155 [Bacilli bacterium]|nr:hypothetical protein [Bacilli bacterium]
MSSIHLAPIFAALASVVSFVFAVQLVVQYAQKHKVYQLWWAISMFLYAVSSFEEFYAPVYGWTADGYRMYYFSAISLVAVMAVGQVFMTFSKRIAAAFAGISLIALALFLIYVLREPLLIDHLQAATGTVAGAGFASESIPRIVFAPILDGIGGILLILLPILSWWKTKRFTPLFVGIGAIVLSLAGSLSHLGLEALLPLAELVGVTVIFYGVSSRQSIRTQLMRTETSAY